MGVVSRSSVENKRSFYLVSGNEVEQPGAEVFLASKVVAPAAAMRLPEIALLP